MPEDSPSTWDQNDEFEKAGWAPVPQQPFEAQFVPMYAAPLPAPTSSRLGRVAMIMALAVLGVSLCISVLVGLFGTTVYHYQTANSAGFNATPDMAVAGFQILFGTIFGVWAVVQGIVATAKNHGRSFGIVAIVVGSAAPIVSLIVWSSLGVAFGHSVGQ